MPPSARDFLKVTLGSFAYYTITSCQNSKTEKPNIILILIDDMYMNFTSSGSDDMDYYIWKPIESE